ncbi:hypothetical protein [Butyrivibrio sp. LC3010]|nr:hypothetical protein [Butyrivibrio sp. LC3010]
MSAPFFEKENVIDFGKAFDIGLFGIMAINSLQVMQDFGVNLIRES